MGRAGPGECPGKGCSAGAGRGIVTVPLHRFSYGAAGSLYRCSAERTVPGGGPDGPAGPEGNATPGRESAFDSGRFLRHDHVGLPGCIQET